MSIGIYAGLDYVIVNYKITLCVMDAQVGLYYVQGQILTQIILYASKKCNRRMMEKS
jgi:hypothetical protein